MRRWYSLSSLGLSPERELPRLSSRGTRAQYSSRRRLGRRHLLFRRANCHGIQAVEYVRNIHLGGGLPPTTASQSHVVYGVDWNGKLFLGGGLPPTREAVLSLDAPTDRGRAPGSFFVTSFRGLRPFGLTLGYILSSPTGTQGKTQSAQSETREDRKERANLLPLTFPLSLISEQEPAERLAGHRPKARPAHSPSSPSPYARLRRTQNPSRETSYMPVETGI